MLLMKESEIPKFLAEELSKAPYNLNLNLISFTSLRGDALMNVFQSVLVEIHPPLKNVLEESTSEERIQSIMELLRVLKFWPKCFDQSTLQTALESVSQEILWDTLGWLLTRREELKKRAYLSQFLVKVPIPSDYLFDSDLQEVYDDYEAKIQEFKAVHKKLEETKKLKGISDLVTDLKAVEREIDSCSRKLDMMKVNVVAVPEKEEHLQLAEELRVARTEKSRLRAQLFVEERKLWCLEKKKFFLSNKVHELAELNNHSSAEGLLERIQQDSEILKFIVHRKIPQDMEETERKIRAVQIVLSACPEVPSDLDSVRNKIFQVEKEVQRLEHQNRDQDTDARLTFARQKAHENKKKKLELLEELEELRRDMLEQQGVLRERREERRQLFPEGIPCLSSRDYKEYVKTMRVKAAKYKAMRQDIAAVQSEVGVLSSTKFLVEEELHDSVQELKKVEEELGLVGFSCIHERLEQEQSGLEQNDESKMRRIYELTEKGRDLQDRVKATKAEVIEPLAAGIIEAKQELKTLELHSKRLSNAWEAEMGPVTESNRRFETRIAKLQEEMIKNEEEICQKTAEFPVMKANLQRALAEAALQKDNPTSSRSFKNRILTRIVDQERLQKQLNQEMAQLEQSQANDIKQIEQWDNLKRLLECKKQLLLAENDDSN